MRYLVDTHAFLWFLNEDITLNANAAAAIEDPSHTIYLSIASLWEIAIKVRIGKLELPQPFGIFIRRQLEINRRLRLLAISIDHLDMTATIPLHHRDPFDHLLIGQALHANLMLITNDSKVSLHPVHRLW